MKHDNAGPGPLAFRRDQVDLELVVRCRDRDFCHIVSLTI
jgi:hypothetical protein